MHSDIDMIVIGVSSGGVDALGRLLPAFAAGWPVAVAIVAHLPPDRPSLLPEVLQSSCAFRIREVEDKERIEPGHVYVAAPDYHMQIEPDFCLSLSSDEEVNFSRPSIDVLFETAAYAYGNRLLGIIMTGSSNDGAEGMRLIGDLGGQCWVQSPQEAVSPTMPLAAAPFARPENILTIANMVARLKAEFA